MFFFCYCMTLYKKEIVHFFKTKYLPWNNIFPWKKHSCKNIMCCNMQYVLFWKSGSLSFLSCISIGSRKVSPLQNKNAWFVPVVHLCGKPYYITQLYIDNLVLKKKKKIQHRAGISKQRFVFIIFYFVVLLLCIIASNNENCSIYIYV